MYVNAQRKKIEYSQKEYANLGQNVYSDTQMHVSLSELILILIFTFVAISTSYKSPARVYTACNISSSEIKIEQI
jgi:hypothetical protein